ncbi:hypothetical protein EC396_13425 [Lutibacter sp. HS1-25]|uniref:hypothetical protein n=1 Tax=Lutibacter sp. HS1-25 TaxID=2485000 RepID=UPI00101285DC|nr:hypothetical protein [Lutibacter sp. HS1-25]RXP46875.1 hypothetical protein EC396_13425 [Lutibacter sp. HS1-25]
MKKIDLENFFINIEKLTTFERIKQVNKLTNKYDLNLLTVLSNSFVEHCFRKFNEINYSLPFKEIEEIEEIEETKESFLYLNEFSFPFYDLINNELLKEVRIERFERIDFEHCKKFNSYMNGFLTELENLITNQNIKIIEIKQEPEINNRKTHPKHDPNLWNAQCFDLFKYLFDEYYTGSKRQVTNIWFYLKEYQSKKYTLIATKKIYKEFILENYQISITNFDKSYQKYEDKDYKTLNEHRINFDDSLK